MQQFGDSLEGKIELIDQLPPSMWAQCYQGRMGNQDIFIKLPKYREGDTDHNAAVNSNFDAEDESLTTLPSHPHIVPYFGKHEIRPGRQALLFKFLNGPNLRDLVEAYNRDGDRLPAYLAAEYTETLVHTFQDIHDNGFLHRDIKAANIVLHDDEPFVIDFGLAREVGPDKTYRASQLEGSVPYVSLETWRTGKYSPATEAWALAVVSWELFTGHVPFKFDIREQDSKVVLNHGAPQLPREVLPEHLQVNLQHFFNVAFDAEQGYKSMDHFLEASHDLYQDIQELCY
jgi:serine/threonine protein kinase